MGTKLKTRTSATPVFKAGLKDKVSAALDVLLFTKSAEEMESPLTHRGDVREHVWAATTTVLPRFEDPIVRARAEAEVMGIARNLKSRKGLMATAMLMALASPGWAQTTTPLTTSPPKPALISPGYATFDATAYAQKNQERFDTWVASSAKDNADYFRYLNTALITYKNYKLARQLYNRVATGRLDLVLIPALPTINFDLPKVDAGGAAGAIENGAKVGEWTHTSINFISTSKEDRDAVWRQLPNFEPKVNLGSQLSSLIKNIDLDGDVIGRSYNADGKLISETDAVSLQRDALGEALSTWLFSYSRHGSSALMINPMAAVDEKNASRQKSEDATLRLVYKALAYQKMKDDGANPYTGPSFKYADLQKTYANMLVRRRALGDPGGMYSLQQQQIAQDIADTKRLIQFHAGQQQAMATQIQVNQVAKKKAADAKEKYQPKATGVDTKVPITALAKTGVIAMDAGANDVPSGQLEFYVTQANNGSATNELLGQMINVLVARNVIDQDEVRDKSIKQRIAAVESMRTDGWVLEGASNILASLTLADDVPPFYLTNENELTAYAKDADGNLVPMIFTKAQVKVADTPRYDANGNNMSEALTGERRAQDALEYSKLSAQQMGADMAKNLTETTGVFGKDFLSELYRVFMSGVKSVFSLSAYNLQQDAAVIANGGKVMSAYQKGYKTKTDADWDAYFKNYDNSTVK